MEIYLEVFNELIRQITINCLERGILLLRVRDQMLVTLEAYKELYKSSLTFATRKQVQGDENIDELNDKYNKLFKKKKIMENKKFYLLNKLDTIKKNYKEINDFDQIERKNEVSFLESEISNLDKLILSLANKDTIEQKNKYEKTLNLN